MSRETETLIEEIEDSLHPLTEDNLRCLCERCGIDVSEVKGQNHRLLRRKIMAEMWENADSDESEEQGMSWLLRLKEGIWKIQEEATFAPVSPGQSDDDDNNEATNCGEWDVEDKDGFPSNGLKAGSSPDTPTPERRGTFIIPDRSSLLPESPGRVCLSKTFLLGLKRVSVGLVDCRKTKGLNGNLRGEDGEDPDRVSSNYIRNDHSFSGMGLSSGKVSGLKGIRRLHGCDLCGKSFSRLGTLTRHQRIHTGEKPYTCEQCGRSFSLSKTLTDHKRTHTGEKPYSCDLCGKSFSRQGTLTAHRHVHAPTEYKETHTAEKPYICDKVYLCSDCGKSFYTLSSFKCHERTHTGEKPYGCDQCGKSFSRSGALIIHKRIHTGEKPYMCDICGKSCKDVTALKEHVRIHTGDKPFSCYVCDMSFAQKSSMNVHLRRHTGEKPYSCDLCRKRFTQKGSLNAHKSAHTGNKPFKCDKCGERFTRPGSVKRHQRTHTGDQIIKAGEVGSQTGGEGKSVTSLSSKASVSPDPSVD